MHRTRHAFCLTNGPEHFKSWLWLGLARILHEPGVDALFAFGGDLYIADVTIEFIAILIVSLKIFLVT